ncbi:MAG: integrin alpha [Dermatophilaceae bacterium]
MSGAPATGLPTSIDLADAGVIHFDGLTAEEGVGNAVSGAGDINNDGYDDIVIGAPGSDVSGDNAGAAYVVLGYPALSSRVLAELGSSGFRVDGAAADDATGSSVAGAGDVNNDGYDDVIIGAPGTDPRGNNEGSAYVLFGSTSPGPVDLATPSADWIRIDGAHTDDHVGTRVAGAGDVNNDGYDDVVVGSAFLSPNGPASGGAYVVYGSAHPVTVDLASPHTWGFEIEGGAAVDFAGAVAGAGDVNNDGFGDVVVGARGVDANGDGAGASYVIYGRGDGHTIDLGALAVTDGFRIDGAAASDNCGYAVAGAGDLNADGYDDVIVSSHNASPDALSKAGSAQVVYGAVGRTVVDLSDPGPAAVRLDGAAAGDMTGWSVAGIGDVNRDQRPDVLIGAPWADPSGQLRAGSTYVVLGDLATPQLDLASLGAAGVRIDGAAAGDESGTSVAGAGDINGDGSGDVLIGAPLADPGGRFDAGQAYLVLGDPTPPEPGPPPATPAATLKVTARSAKKTVPRTGKASLVRRVRVGSGQKARITAGVTPAKTRKRATLKKTATTVRIRTKRAPRGKVKVVIRATGPGVTAVTWKRTWRIR